MPVVKSNQAPSILKDAVVLDLGDVSRQAGRIRMAAEAQAGQIISDAEREAQALIEKAESIGFKQGCEAGIEQGTQQGHEQGYAEALKQTRDELAQLQTAWKDVAEQLDGQRREMDSEARQSVLTFALKMAERLILRVIEVDATVVVDQVAQALATITDPMDVSVHIHPGDRDILAEAMPQLMSEFDQFKHVHLIDDTAISRGGCIVTYGQGQIDATVQKQIDRVIDVILPPPEIIPRAIDAPSDIPQPPSSTSHASPSEISPEAPPENSGGG